MRVSKRRRRPITDSWPISLIFPLPMRSDQRRCVAHEAQECPLGVISGHLTSPRHARFTPNNGQPRWHVRKSAISRHRGRSTKALTAWSSTADSFEDEAIDDAANRALLCEVGSDQAVRGLCSCTMSRRALSALHTSSFPTRLFGVALSCPSLV